MTPADQTWRRFVIVAILVIAAGYLVWAWMTPNVPNAPSPDYPQQFWDPNGVLPTNEPTFEELQREKYLDCVTAGGEWLQGGVCDWYPAP